MCVCGVWVFFTLFQNETFIFSPVFYCNKEAIPQKFNIIVLAGNIYIHLEIISIDSTAIDLVWLIQMEKKSC